MCVDEIAIHFRPNAIDRVNRTRILGLELAAELVAILAKVKSARGHSLVYFISPSLVFP